MKMTIHEMNGWLEELGAYMKEVNAGRNE